MMTEGWPGLAQSFRGDRNTKRALLTIALLPEAHSARDAEKRGSFTASWMRLDSKLLAHMSHSLAKKR